MSTQSANFVYTPTSSGTYTWRFRRVHSGANAPASSYTLDNLKVSYVIPYTRTECPETDLAYRFGFNTQEKDDEVYGAGNLNTAEFWEYDTRLGRRWNVDPVDQIYISNYATFKNNPILFEDILGNTPGKTIGEKIEDFDKKVMEKISPVAAKISEPVVKAVNKFENFVKSSKDIGIGGQIKYEFGAASISVKAENWSTHENNAGFTFGIEVEGKIGIKASDLNNPGENSLIKTYKIARDFYKNNINYSAIKKNFKGKVEGYLFANTKKERVLGRTVFYTKREFEVKASIPINGRINAFGSKNDQGQYKLGITNIDKPSLEMSGKSKLGFSFSTNPIWFH